MKGSDKGSKMIKHGGQTKNSNVGIFGDLLSFYRIHAHDKACTVHEELIL